MNHPKRIPVILGTISMTLAVLGCESNRDGSSLDAGIDPGIDVPLDIPEDSWVPPTDAEEAWEGEEQGEEALGEVPSSLDSGAAEDEARWDDEGNTGACGNGRVEPGEECERFQEGPPCTSLGMNFVGGSLWCEEDCSGWSRRACLTQGQYCGNGIKEGAAGIVEACDGDAIPCQELNQGRNRYTGGMATCAFNCWTRNTSGCTHEVPPYGTISIRFATPFLMDEDRLGDNAYVQQAAAAGALVRAAAFTGTFSDQAKIPDERATRTLTYGIHGSQRRTVYVIQESFAPGPEGEFVYQPPHFELRFPDDRLEPGEYPLTFGVMGATRIWVFRYTGTDGDDRCLLAVAIGGLLRVTRVENPTAPDGGILEMEADDVPIFHVTETPLGDMSGDFQTTGVPICPR